MKNMKNLYRVALLAALGLATASVANAQTTPAAGDFLLGFNDAAGPTSAQNDYVIDLGSETQFTSSATLNLSSDFSVSTFNSAFGTDADALSGNGGNTSLSDVAVGAVGGNGTLPNKQFYQTLGIGSAVGSSSIGTAINLAGPAYGEYSSATANGFSYLVATSPGSAGTDPSDSIASVSLNPLSYLTSGIVTEGVYEAQTVVSGRTTTYSSAEVGTLTINLNTDSITYAGISAVPEPSTYGLLAGFGLLVVAVRRQMVRKNA
ncbi:MAG: PEP-CTERM sorting domain-containing protein [Verrucomicrobiota bacterium]|jgi:hypothetical protein